MACSGEITQSANQREAQAASMLEEGVRGKNLRRFRSHWPGPDKPSPILRQTKNTTVFSCLHERRGTAQLSKISPLFSICGIEYSHASGTISCFFNQTVVWSIDC